MGSAYINERKEKYHKAPDRKMEEKEFHLPRLTALWPSIDLLECPLCAQPALDRLITPDPYPKLLYIQHSRPISADHTEQSAISEEVERGRGETRLPRFGDSSPGESIPPVKQSVKHQAVKQTAINPPLGEWNASKHYLLRDEQLPTGDETVQLLWENECFLIRALPSFPNPDPLSLTPDKSTPSPATLSLNHPVPHTLTSLKSADCHHYTPLLFPVDTEHPHPERRVSTFTWTVSGLYHGQLNYLWTDWLHFGSGLLILGFVQIQSGCTLVLLCWHMESRQNDETACKQLAH